MIEIKELSKAFMDGQSQRVILDRISFTIKEGDFFGIIGQSGSGKSSLLNILGLIDEPSSGTYYFGKRNMSELNRDEAASFRNQEIGYIFQHYHLLNHLKTWENVALPLVYAGVKKDERKERALALLEQVGLSQRAMDEVKNLSGGERQRVAIARALINQPSLLLADEPTGALDQENSEMVFKLLQELNQEGLTIVMVTHDLELSQKMDRVLRLRS